MDDIDTHLILEDIGHDGHTGKIHITSTTSSSSTASSPYSDTDTGIFDAASVDHQQLRPDLVSRFSQATTVVEGDEYSPGISHSKTFDTGLLSPGTAAAMSAVAPAVGNNNADSTSNLVLALLHALEADPAEIANKLHELDHRIGITPSLEHLSKEGVIPYHPSTSTTLSSSTTSSTSSSSTSSPDSPNEAIVASISRIAQRLAKSEELLKEASSSITSSNNTTPDDEGGPPPPPRSSISAASVAGNAASSAIQGTGNAVSRLIGMYNTKATPSTSNAPPSIMRRTSSSSGVLPSTQSTQLAKTGTGDGSVRPDKIGENEEDERLCHRCGGHIIRASEVGLADEDVIDGQSESLSAEKELKLLKAQVQDFARVCKVSSMDNDSYILDVTLETDWNCPSFACNSYHPPL